MMWFQCHLGGTWPVSFQVSKNPVSDASVSDVSVSKLSVSSCQVSDDASWFWPYESYDMIKHSNQLVAN